MSSKADIDHSEAARLDRERTGNSVNARTDELKKELERETDQLQRKYEDSGTPGPGGK
jgi:hypothetical protein